MRTIALAIGLGFIFIFAFSLAERLVERNRVLTAQRFERLTSVSFELGANSQQVALLLFGMLSPRGGLLQERLTQQIFRELQEMKQGSRTIASERDLPAYAISSRTREGMAAVTETSDRFVEMAIRLLRAIPSDGTDRPPIPQFVEQAALVLKASRETVNNLSTDAVRSAEADEAWKLVFFLLSAAAAAFTASVVLLFVVSRLRRAVGSLRVTENQLAQANGDLERFSSLVARDLDGPLDSIALRVNAIKQIASGVPQMNETTDAVAREIEHLREMVQALLRISRTRGSSLSPSSFDLPALIEEVRTAIRERIEASAALVRYQGVRSMRGDRALFYSLFQNLIENSVCYKRDDAPPVVEIFSSYDPYQLLFRYEDNGLGIPKSERARVFEPLVRLHEGKASRGAGLGLSLVKRIVQAHGGQIFITDKDEPGTRFMISIPQDTSGRRPSNE